MTVDSALPGADLVAAGLQDLRRGALTVEALLVLTGKTRLAAAGLEVPPAGLAPDSAHLELYRKIASAHPREAHARYNSLLQRLVSFACALERATATKPSDAG